MTTTGYRESGWHLQMFLECLLCARFQAGRQVLQIMYRSVGLSIVNREANTDNDDALGECHGETTMEWLGLRGMGLCRSETVFLKRENAKTRLRK